MLRKNILLSLIFLLSSLLLLSGCVKRSYFVADPFWQEVSGVSFNQVRFMGLLSGNLVSIRGTNSAWLTSVPQGNAIQANGEPKSLSPLLPQIEAWLDAGHKVILSPYWHRDLEKTPIQSQSGQLVLLDFSSANPRFQSVLSDTEDGFYKMGQAAGSYVQRKAEREQAIAIFYRGAKYDRYYESFVKGYQLANIDINSLAPLRYYAAEINEINIAIESIEASNSLVIIAMAHLSNLVYRQLSSAKDSLLMVENYGSNVDPLGSILLSLDTDYKHLLQSALQVEPGAEPEKVPYVLNLPNPALLSDISGFEELAQQSFERQRRAYNRLDRRISRWWNWLLDFLTEFPERLPGALPWNS